jgi:hypothetical protein
MNNRDLINLINIYSSTNNINGGTNNIYGGTNNINNDEYRSSLLKKYINLDNRIEDNMIIIKLNNLETLLYESDESDSDLNKVFLFNNPDIIKIDNLNNLTIEVSDTFTEMISDIIK